MNVSPRTYRTAAALGLGALALSGCSVVSTAPDEAGLHYQAGPLSSTKFENCVAPSTRNVDGLFDAHALYPAGQRSYAFSADPKADSKPITVTDINGVPLSTTGVVTFTLNTDCKTLQKFHEQIGLKYGAANVDGRTSEGWGTLIATYLRQPLERTLTDATQGLEWKQLYTEPATKAQWEKDVKDTLPRYVEQTMGGAYLGDFSVTLQKPDLPENLAKAITATQEAIQQNAAQQERNVQVQSELESIRALVDVLGPDGYNTYEAIKNGKISIVPVPQGTNLNITPDAQK